MIVGIAIDYLIKDQRGDAAVLRKMQSAIERAGDEIKDFERYLWPRVTTAFETEMQKQFAEEGGGPGRGRWADLSPAYAKWKEQNFPGQPILQRTGDMYRALTDSADPHALRVTQGDRFEFGTRGLPYPSFHQLGTQLMPDRPPFDFSNDFKQDINAAMMGAVRDALEASGADEVFEVVD